MSEVSERYAVIADGFGARLAGVTGDQWSGVTPCSEWTVRDLVGHVVETHRRVLAALRTGEPAAADTDENLPDRWASASAAVGAALTDPALASSPVSGPFGEQPFESVVGRLLCADTLIHTWDLARATGQDERLDPGATARALEFLTPIDDAIRRPGAFGAKIDPAPGSDPQTALLNFCGRAV